jgi:hypothetical protein
MFSFRKETFTIFADDINQLEYGIKANITVSYCDEAGRDAVSSASQRIKTPCGQ